MEKNAFNAEYTEARRTQGSGFLSVLCISARSVLKEVKDFYNV